MKQHCAGFTLIELMIVVAIVGVLAAIALPQYLRFGMRAKRVDVLALHREIFAAQFAYFSEADSFVTDGQANGWIRVHQKLGLRPPLTRFGYEPFIMITGYEPCYASPTGCSPIGSGPAIGYVFAVWGDLDGQGRNSTLDMDTFVFRVNHPFCPRAQNNEPYLIFDDITNTSRPCN